MPPGFTDRLVAMRSLPQRATTALFYVCLFFAVVATAVGVAGIRGVGSVSDTGKLIARDELHTSTITAQVAQGMNAAYATAERALLTADEAQRARFENDLYAHLVPEADAAFAELQRIHTGDDGAELQDIRLLDQQWAAVRDLMSPTRAITGTQPALADRLAVAFGRVTDHINALVLRERTDAADRESYASSTSASTIRFISATIAAGLLATLFVAWFGTRRIRKAFEPERDQVDFGNTLQIADAVVEAHQLLQRHLERALPGSTAVVLNRNNSADRIEAITPLPAGSPLIATLAKAEPRSCLAVRSGRAHFESADRPGLLACPVCAVCPGNSTCTPLTVAGEVIGSVLMNRPTPFIETELQRVHDSVSQAAPVLANLRNLAIAEIRAATDSLTGLPNKRAVTDTLKRMFAQATRTGSPLSIVLLDLDHFKDVNDRHGHPVGDQALANVGAVLRTALRASDFAGRNGGEEFALLLPDTDISAAVEIAQRVRSAIAEIILAEVDLQLTASLGVATYPDHADGLDRLIRVADAALYLAKRSGRNRAEVASPTSESLDPMAGDGLPEPRLPDPRLPAEAPTGAARM